MSIPLRPALVLLAVIAVVVVIVLLAVGAFGGGEAGDEAQQAQKSQTGRISAQDLRVGDCVTDARATTGDVTTFNAVDCAKPHDGEVYTLIELEGTSYPGQEFLTAKGNRGCRARLKRQVTRKALRDRNLAPFRFVYPTEASWAQDYRRIACLATFITPRKGRLSQRRATDS